MSSCKARCLVRGSLNIDEFFHLEHIVKPGQTVSSTQYERRAGGKGANQAVAVARAGGSTELAGAIGNDGRWLLEYLEKAGVGVSAVTESKDHPTGRAIIQLSPDGENCIILHKGANYASTPPIPSSILQSTTHILLQNEIPFESTLFTLLLADSMHITTVFNPSPLPSAAQLRAFPWDKLSWLVINEHEMYALYDALGAQDVDLDAADVPWPPEYQFGLEPPARLMVCSYLVRLRCAKHFFRDVNVVCTLGAEGVIAFSRAWSGFLYVRAASLRGDARDTTGAGDCFTGYLVAGLMKFHEECGSDVCPSVEEMKTIFIRCTSAAGMCVERRGAMESVPDAAEVDARLREEGFDGASTRDQS